MPTPQVSVIIPVFNQWAFTAQSLRSLKEHTSQDVEVIVIDNASTDQTVTDLDILGKELWKDSFTSVHLPENQGFARASNLGARLAQADILFFLNNDTLLTPNWLPPLLQALDTDTGLGAVGPLLLYPGSGLVQHLGLAFLPGPEVKHLYDYFPPEHSVVRKPRQPKALTAAALCMSKQVFWSANGFHEGYQNGCEDIDLCLSLGQHGYRFRCVPESTVLHFTSKTEGRFEHDIPNSTLLISRHEQRLIPDIHLHAAQDGYAITLNEWLLISSSLTPDRTAELNELATGCDPQRWFDMLEQNPLWEQGYGLLADWLEAQQSFQDALHIRALDAQFHPSRDKYIHLIKTAHKAQVPIMIKHAQEKLEIIATKMSEVRRKAIQRIQWAKASREPFWEKLYTDWLTNHEATFKQGFTTARK